jgi:large subunit ribosomal protein L25
MKSIDIKGTLRTDLGKKATRAKRREGFVPGVVYGGNVAVHFSADPKELKNLVYTPDFQKINLAVDGKTYSCILKDKQFHPVSDELLHIDLLLLEAGKKVIANIPVRCDGVAAGVKEGGRLNQKLRTVIVKTTPDELTDELLVDVRALKLGESVRVKHIKINDKMEMISSMNSPVATIDIPRSMRSAATTTAAAAAADTGKKKK